MLAPNHHKIPIKGFRTDALDAILGLLSGLVPVRCGRSYHPRRGVMLSLTGQRHSDLYE